MVWGLIKVHEKYNNAILIILEQGIVSNLGSFLFWFPYLKSFPSFYSQVGEITPLLFKEPS